MVGTMCLHQLGVYKGCQRGVRNCPEIHLGHTAALYIFHKIHRSDNSLFFVLIFCFFCKPKKRKEKVQLSFADKNKNPAANDKYRIWLVVEQTFTVLKIETQRDLRPKLLVSHVTLPGVPIKTKQKKQDHETIYESKPHIVSFTFTVKAHHMKSVFSLLYIIQLSSVLRRVFIFSRS